MAEMTESDRILVVVEDDPDMRLMIRVLFEVDGRLHIVGEASDAWTAIEIARETHPNVIILDHQLEGDLMGLDAAPLLKDAAPEAKILLFSAFDLKEEAAAQPAVDVFLPKASVGKLITTVQQMLGLAPL